MTDIATHKARVDAARDLTELAKVAADAEAAMAVEHWPRSLRLDFEDHRYARALELADRIRRAG